MTSGTGDAIRDLLPVCSPLRGVEVPVARAGIDPAGECRDIKPARGAGNPPGAGANQARRFAPRPPGRRAAISAQARDPDVILTSVPCRAMALARHPACGSGGFFLHSLFVLFAKGKHSLKAWFYEEAPSPRARAGTVEGSRIE